MADELRLALILLGTLAIGAVILHGIWTVRKTVNEEKKLAKAKQEPQETEVEAIDEEEKAANLHQMEMDFTQLEQAKGGEGLPVVDVDVDSIYQSNEVAETEQKVDAEPDQEEVSIDVNQDIFEDEREPEFSGFTAVDDEHVEVEDISIETTSDEQSTQQADVEESQPQEVLMLFIDKKDGEEIDGAKLLPILLTLGFKFGEMDFFHRHEDNAGKGEVLFSLANMYNPGTFDIDKMEQISTRGLTMFMTLPNAAEPLQTFNMMHNAAKKIADEFDAVVLDGNRQPLDVAIVRSYVERIRKFQN